MAPFLKVVYNFLVLVDTIDQCFMNDLPSSIHVIPKDQISTWKTIQTKFKKTSMNRAKRHFDIVVLRYRF